MQADSIAPCLILYAFFIGLGSLICGSSHFFRALCADTRPGKVETLDGFRAYLALGVFFHHGVITYFWFANGVWDIPESAFYRLIGPYSVIFFFMITSFLFWSKAIRNPRSVAPRRLLVGRILRIGPLYLFMSALVYGTILVQAGFRLSGDFRKIVIGLVSPLALGLIQWQPINEVIPAKLNAEVTWSLQWEWYFYLALPLLAWLATPRRFLILGAIAIGLFPFAKVSQSAEYWLSLQFFAGMAAAQALQWLGPFKSLSSRYASVVAIGLLILIPYASLLGYRTEKAVVVAILFSFFLCVVNGNTIFGALTTRGARFLGTISYSIYLLHAFVLFLGRSILIRWMGPGSPSPMTFWAFMVVCGVITILCSTVTYRYIEHPFIELSHRIGGRRAPVKAPIERGTQLEPAQV